MKRVFIFNLPEHQNIKLHTGAEACPDAYAFLESIEKYRKNIGQIQQAQVGDWAVIIKKRMATVEGQLKLVSCFVGLAEITDVADYSSVICFAESEGRRKGLVGKPAMGVHMDIIKELNKPVPVKGYATAKPELVRELSIIQENGHIKRGALCCQSSPAPFTGLCIDLFGFNPDISLSA